MRKLIAKRFCTVSVNEFRTSKLCCNCFGQLQHLCVETDAKKKKVFRCLICPECESSASKQPTFWTRDLNSALNIRQLALKWMTERTRPVAFCRAAGLARTSRTAREEKTGQSVDLRRRRASEPALKKMPAFMIKSINKAIKMSSRFDCLHLVWIVFVIPATVILTIGFGDPGTNS